MASQLKVLKVFLASPNDLAPERRAAKDVVESLNRAIAGPLNWHLQLAMWEDLAPGYSRPQMLIKSGG
jgi:hypothetical protein